MTEATSTVTATGRMTEAAGHTSATITHGARRLWLAGLGVFAVAAEWARGRFETLERKGEDLEPSVVAPLRRAGEAANRMAQRAGVSAHSVSDVVGNATAAVAGLSRRLGIVDVAEEVRRAVDERLPAALERLDLPTKKDLQALADRIEDLTARSRQSRDS